MREMDKERKKGRRRGHMGRMIGSSMVLAMILSLLPVDLPNLQASVWNNAYSYYESYGNTVMFHSVSATDGEIYYATKASKASTNIKYRTVGWKVSLESLSGTQLQTLYFKLDGGYMYHVDTRTKSNYEYNLYALPLNNLKRRLNSKADKAMQEGKCRIRLDACMVVVKKGKAKGAMDDSGPTSGNVYTTYSGIAGAENWSSSAKQSFYSYFDKEVQGLFFNITVNGDEGISAVKGGGYYCYGMLVTLKAAAQKGYEFDMWEGPDRSVHPEVSFYANCDEKWVATTTRKNVRIVFHRNLSEGDSALDWQTVYYGKSERFSAGWKSGKDAVLLGWAFTADADKPVYSEHAVIKDNWILKYSPQVELYAVWEKKQKSHNPIPAPPVPDPDEPTPAPPVPDPDEPTPDLPVPDPDEPTSDPPVSDPDEPIPESTTSKEIHCRFISSKYFEDSNHNLIPQDKGGLASDSRWVQDQVLRQLLRYVLTEG